MCGIIAVIAKRGDKEKAREAMMNQFENQHNRGGRGFGLVELTPKGFRVRKATEPIKALLDVRMSDAGILLFHHRAPTSTDNTLQTAHPILVSHAELSGDWYVEHNGVIRNCDELKKKHEALGYVYNTVETKTYSMNNHYSKYNDSEAFAIELVRYLEGLITEVEWQGPAAFTAAKISKKTNKPSCIVFGRGETNPLQMFEDEDNLIIASDIPGQVMTMPEKTVAVLQIKAIQSPDLWPKESKDNTPLLDMATLGEIKIKEKVVVAVSSHSHSGYSPNSRGFQDKKKTTGLLEAGRNGSGGSEEKMLGNAVIRFDAGPEERDSDDDSLTPRLRGFFKMADKVSEKINVTLTELFTNLSEGEVDDKDMKEYMTQIEKAIRARFDGATRARFHFDKYEEDTMNADLAMQHEMGPKNETQVAVDKLVEDMSG